MEHQPSSGDILVESGLALFRFGRGGGRVGILKLRGRYILEVRLDCAKAVKWARVALDTIGWLIDWLNYDWLIHDWLIYDWLIHDWLIFPANSRSG